jgi:hypothetical protein
MAATPQCSHSYFPFYFLRQPNYNAQAGKMLNNAYCTGARCAAINSAARRSIPMLSSTVDADIAVPQSRRHDTTLFTSAMASLLVLFDVPADSTFSAGACNTLHRRIISLHSVRGSLQSQRIDMAKVDILLMISAGVLSGISV